MGDVPTAANLFDGVVGVWLTSSDSPADKGLDGSAIDKKKIRVAVEVDECSALLHHWPRWAKANAAPGTYEWLASAAGTGADPTSWYVYFGWIRPEMILGAHVNGSPLPDWQNFWPEELSLPAVRFRDRERWRKKLVKNIAAAYSKQQAAARLGSPTLVPK